MPVADPYAVLGISPGADEETIKKAYRQKCKQYHPDLHPNDPACEEKFKEVQAAYSEITRPHSAGSGYGGQSGYQSGAGGQYQNPFGGGWAGYGPFGFGFGYSGTGAGRSYADTSPELQAAGNYIRSGYYREALNVLDGMAPAARTARWHYYAAVACHGLGNNIRAVDEARAAAEMEPGNYQYQNLLDQLQNPGRVYNSYRQARPQPGAPGGGLCMNLLLCNILSMLCCRMPICWC